MANKKINQLVLKTTIQSTDLFPLGDPTTGQLFKKTVAELQAAIGGAVISVNGLVGTVVLDTDDIQELANPTNRYFTEARARASISLTTTGNSGSSTYSNSTGVLNVPTYTLAGLGGITASFLSGGTGITYNSGTGVISYSGTVFTDASIRALVSAGAGLSYNSSTGVFSYSGTVYTDASIRALISLTTSGSSGASTYNSTTGVLNVPTYTLAGLGGISLTSLSGSAPITYNSSTGAIGITQASGSTNGFLSSTDWTTFNSKQNALTLGNVTEAVSNVLMFPDGQNGKTIGNLSIQVVQAGSTTNGYLSSTDWNTFNNKQNAITLTTTGTSGAATFSSGTLNIPQYQAVLTNPVTGTGTTNYVTKWTSSSAIGNSLIFDTGSNVGIGTTTPLNLTNSRTLQINGTNSSYYTLAAGGTRYFSILTTSSESKLETNAAIPLIFATNETERMRINSNGDTEVRSGYKLNISRGDNARALQLYTDNNACYIDAWETTSEPLVLRSNGTSGRIQFHTNGSERMRITSAGNVGIGTTSPNASLTIVAPSSSNAITLWGRSTDNYSAIRFQSNTGATTYSTIYSDASNLIFENGGSERMRISSDGKLYFGSITTGGTGTTSPVFISLGDTFGTNTLGTNYKIRLFQPINGIDIYGLGVSSGLFEISSAGSIGFFTNISSERGRITTGGNWLLGTTTDNGERLYVSGSIRATGSITANSDARLKKNIERIENALEKVGQISGYTYNTIYDEDRHAGVIAQEIDLVLPEIVNKGNDGLMGVEYGNISALLIEAIKDLKQRNEKLEAIVEGLSK